jgi:DNA-directed RNA polymerase subunit RPC12/RpoP
VIGAKESPYDLIVAVVFAAIVVIAALAWLVGQITSRLGKGYGCYDCGWRGKRHEMYQRVAGLDGIAFHLIIHFFLVYYMLYHMFARASAALRCPQCASPNVLRQTVDAPPLPPPRKSLKAREFLKRKRKGTESPKLTSSLVRCNACQAIVALDPVNLALACPHCGSQPFIYSNA